jgi:protein ImuB
LRILCLLVPLFPLAARLRSEPELAAQSTVVVLGSGSAARVVAATRPARRAGVRGGMSLAQARALAPDLSVRARDPECEASAQQTLLEIAEAHSPRVEDGGDGLAYLDLDGLERHVSGGHPDAALARSVMVSAERHGLPLWTGVASSKLAARIAAELPDSPVVVAAGEEAAFLAPLPLARLSPALEIAETLARWGLATIGDLARLPKNEVASRLGPEGRELHQLARGLDSRPLVPRHPPPSFRESMELDWPLVNLEPFLFVGRAALERLCRRLETHGLACAQLDLSLELEPAGRHERSIRLPAPTREVKTLLTIARLDLEADPPRAPVTGFAFVAHPDAPRQAQLSFFGPTVLAPDRLATTLARLFSLLGRDRVGSPRAVDGYRPERFEMVEYSPPPPPRETLEIGTADPDRGSHGLMAVRVLRPPVEIEVLTATHGPTGQPVELRTSAREGSDRRPRLDGRVRVASGPWALEEKWWSEEPLDRDYWDVELDSGGIYRIFRDNRSSDWFADGIYD